MSIIFFDFETGGLLSDLPEIQLAAIAVDGWNELESFESKIIFDESKCDADALRINRYTKEAWVNALSESRVVSMFAGFLNRHASVEMTSKAGRPYSVARLAGHNAASFDFPRLQAMFKRNEAFLPASFHVLDTLQRAIWFSIESETQFKSYKLADLCGHFGIETPEAHDALADCRASAALAKKLLGI